MIQLTRLNNQPLALNSDLIKFVERAPDTVITLVTGEKLVVRETTQQILDRILLFRRSIVAGLGPAANPAMPQPVGNPDVQNDE
jgi:flagellar protein FlbD